MADANVSEHEKDVSEQSFCDQLKAGDPPVAPDAENDSLEEDTPLVIDTNQDSSEKPKVNENNASKTEEQETNPKDSENKAIDVNNSDVKEATTTVENNGFEKKSIDEAEAKTDDSNSLSNSESILKKLKCSCCDNKIDLYLQGMGIHPVLKVALCESCSLYYNNWEFVRDVDGKDNQCRWCAKGGDLIVCDTCHNSFCKDCVERNLGSQHLQNILDLDEDVTWSCYVCNDKPLAELRKLGAEAMKINDELEKKLPPKKTNGSLSTQSSVSKSHHQRNEKSLTDNFCRKNFNIGDVLDSIDQVKPKQFLPILEGTKSCLQEILAFVEDAQTNFKSIKTPNEQTTFLNNFKGQYRYYLFNKLGRFSMIDREDCDDEDLNTQRRTDKLRKSSSNAGKRGRPKSRRPPSSEDSEDNESRSPSVKRGKAGQKRKAAHSDSESNASSVSDSDDEYSPQSSKRGRRASSGLKKRGSVGARGRKSKRKADDSEEDEGSDGDWRPQKKAKGRPSLNRSKSGSGSKRGRRKRGGAHRSDADEEKESRPKRNIDRPSMAEVDSDADLNNEEDNEDNEESKEPIAAN